MDAESGVDSDMALKSESSLRAWRATKTLRTTKTRPQDSLQVPLTSLNYVKKTDLKEVEGTDAWHKPWTSPPSSSA